MASRPHNGLLKRTRALQRALLLTFLLTLLLTCFGAEARGQSQRAGTPQVTTDRPIGRGLSGAGSSITLDSSTIRASVARTLADLLSARVPGLNVTYPTGAPGYAPEITARGATGLFGPGRPLLYVDGVLQREDRHLIAQLIDRQRPSHAWSLPTDEIESVEVVLGPAGGSLLAFGASRGAVMVRTRRPKAGAWRFTQYAEALASAAPAGPPTRVTTTGLTASDATDFCPLTDQATGFCTANGSKVHRPYGGDSPFQTSTTLRAGLGLEGGLRVAQVRIADVRVAAHMDRSAGAVRNNSFERYDLSAIASSAPWRSLRTTFTARFARTGGHYARLGQDGLLSLGGLAVSPTDTAFRITVRDADSIIARALPYHADRLTVGLASEWTPRAWLTAFVQGSAERTTRGSDLNAAVYSVLPADVFSGRDRDRSSFRQGASAASAGLRASRALPFGLRVAGEFGRHLSNLDIDERRRQERVSVAGDVSGNQSRLIPDVRSSALYSAWRLHAGPERSIGGGFRKEATKLFGQTFGDDVFNTVDASWTISTERFFPRIPGIQRMALRGAYGESGDHETLLSLFDRASVFEAGAVPARLPRTLEREAGLDLAMLGGSATIGVTAFTRALRDGYFNSTATSGLGAPLSFASWATHGAEWSITLPLRDAGPVRWRARASWSSARTRITQAQFPSTFRTLVGGSRVLFGAGVPFGAVYSTRYTFADVNNDGIIDATEITLAANPTRAGVTQPTDVLGLTADLQWRSWLRAGFSLDGKFGHVKYDGSAVVGCQFLICRDLYDRGASLARQARAVASGYARTFTGPMHRADFIRARDIWLRFVLPPRLGPLALQGASLTVAARNVRVWSRYPFGDPETGSFAFPTVQRGDFYTPALPATFSLRLDIAR